MLGSRFIRLFGESVFTPVYSGLLRFGLVWSGLVCEASLRNFLIISLPGAFILISLDKLNKLTGFSNPLNMKDRNFLTGAVGPQPQFLRETGGWVR